MFVAPRELSLSSSVGAACADMSLLRSYDRKRGSAGYKHPAPDGACQTSSLDGTRRAALTCAGVGACF